MMKAMRSVTGRAVSVVVAVHVAAVMFGAMDPSGAVTKGVVPSMGVVPAPMTMTMDQPVPPVWVVVG